MTTFWGTTGLLLADSDVNPVPVILTLIVVVLAIGLLTFLAKQYKRCPSNKILVKYGKTGSGAAQCIHGGATFVIPLLQAYEYLDLEPFVVPIQLTNALSNENIRVSVPTTVTAAISNQPGIMQNAAIRLLGLSRKQIEDQAQDIILGQMRAVIATMGIEQINRDRQAFMGKVNEAVSGEMEKIGLVVINVNIRDIEDESGYIEALGRKAAAEAVNQANVDVAEQERTGQIGVAERNRDQRVAVAAANTDAEIGEADATRKQRQEVARLEAEAQIGEATAQRDQRQQKAALDAQAVDKETEADGAKATYRANQRVAEEQARNRSESASREADGAIRVAQENAQKQAEDARALREESRLKAEIVVPADADRERKIIQADAEKQQTIRVAQGEAEGKLAKMTAEGRGQQAILEGKATGYHKLVEACRTAQQAAAMLLIERLADIAGIQAQAIQDLPIEKVFVWDGGGKDSGMAGLGHRLMGALPPMHDLAKQVGLELPDFLGRVSAEAEGQKKTSEADSPADDRQEPA